MAIQRRSAARNGDIDHRHAGGFLWSRRIRRHDGLTSLTRAPIAPIQSVLWRPKQGLLRDAHAKDIGGLSDFRKVNMAGQRIEDWRSWPLWKDPCPWGTGLGNYLNSLPETETVIDKPEGIPYATDLDLVLRRNGIEIVLGGSLPGACVHTTCAMP